MTATSPLELSVIVVTPDCYASISNAIRHVLAQAVRDRIELVIVAPRRETLELVESDLEAFHSWQVVEIGKIDSGGQMVAAGVRAANAPVVVYVEEHSFPEPGWAQALIDAHRAGWSAVGPAVSNANPDTRTSWAALFLEFGTWARPATAGECTLLPSHQTSYKRSILLSYGPQLDDLMEAETTLHAILIADGHRLYFEPAAVTRHVNVSKVSELTAIEYHNYRMFAANRARHGRWRLSRRALYVVGGPLLPLVRSYRVLRQLRHTGVLRERGAGIVIPLAMGVLASSAGELMGYVFGAGASAQNRLTFELERLRHVTNSDREKVMAS